MAHRFDREISLSLKPDEDSQGRGKLNPLTEPIEHIQYLWGIQINQAGMAAEIIKYDCNVDDLVDGEYRYDWNYILCYVKEFICRTSLNFDSAKELQKALLNETIDILRQNWSVVEALAQALLEQQEMTEEQVRQIIECWETKRSAD